MKFILMMSMKAGAESNSKGIMKLVQERHRGPYRIHDVLKQGELRDSGELVSAEGLAWPDQAKVIRAGKDGMPITDGVFPEAKELLVGY